MTEIETLLAIEEIKCLKSRYFRFFDTKDWARWKSEVWAPDATLTFSDFGETVLEGAEAIVSFCEQGMANQTTVHHGHMPEIEVLSSDTARGVWAMEDILRVAEGETADLGYKTYHGFGHYHETYVKLAEGWRIKSTVLTRLLSDRT